MAAAGHLGDFAAASEGLGDEDAGVRCVALGALRRLGRLDAGLLGEAFADPAAVVRRRACEEAAALGAGAGGAATLRATVSCLADPDPGVVEAACFAIGELGQHTGDEPDPPDAVGALSAVAENHKDPLCREAAVAALGALGDPRGLPAILAATSDRPAVRRRAVLALAPFEGAQVDAALTRALHDRDWQVRQAAEDLGATDEPG